MSLKISQMAAAAALVGTEQLELSQLSTTVKITAATISAAAADNSFNDSGLGFVAAGFAVNDTVQVTGFTGSAANNIYSATVTAVTTGKLTIGGTDGDVIVDDAAGESVTITKWNTRRQTIGTAAALASDTDATLAANSDTRVATQAAVKAYADALVAGLSWKQAVRAATTAAGTLATSFANASVIDGVTLATGDRILIKNQAAGAENGIYVVAASGAPARATDANSSAELVNASVYVSEGTTLADTQWTCTTNAPITVDTTALTFAQFTSASTSVATDVIWDAAGDLVQGTGANTAARLAIGTAGQVLTVNAGATAAEWAAPSRVGMPFEKELSLSDLTTAITTGTTKAYFRPSFAATDVSYRASLKVASSSGIPTIDMNKNGVSMATTTKLTIDATELTSQTAAAAVAMTTTTWAIDDLIEFDIDVAGTGAMGLIVTVTGKYA